MNFLFEWLLSIFRKPTPQQYAPKNMADDPEATLVDVPIPRSKPMPELELKEGQLSENFWVKEIFGVNSGKHTIFDEWKARYIAQTLLQPPRTEFGKEVKVNSGKRGKAYNKEIGGSKTSDHMYNNECAAADIKFKDGSDNRDMFLWMHGQYYGKEMFGQLIAYIDLAGKVRFIHISKPSQKRIDHVLLARYPFEDGYEGKQKYNAYQGKLTRP